MEKIWTLIKRFAKEQEGMETVEYAVVGALVVAVAAGVWAALGDAVEAKIIELTTYITG